MIGRTLDHYHVVERIGAGGMGIVYRARDERLERDVALKVLPAELLTDEQARARFRREALALSRLNHPNVASVYDFGHAGGVDYLVLEFIPGRTLEELVAAGPLPEAEIVEIGPQLLDGLAAAHAASVLHRDLKPANVKITPDGRVKVLDFGLARLRGFEGDGTAAPTVTGSNVFMGTLPFMSPEQIRGGTVDERSDLHAVGAILYQLATGRRPFPQPRPEQLLHAILNEAPEPPRSQRPDLSPALERIILDALAKDPADRPPSAGEMAERLRSLLRGDEPTRPIRRPASRRNWRLLPIALGAAGVVVVALALILLPGRIACEPDAARAMTALAVLPLENLSAHEEEYFADGLTDQLITDLGRISALRVISRTSVMQYKGARSSIRAIARALGVGAVVEGSVLRLGDRVRVTARLISAKDERNIWSDSFEDEVKDVLTLQGSIARTIAEHVRVRLEPGERERLSQARTVDPEAYRAYLRGRYQWNRFTRDSFDEAEREFRRALEIDPSYAQAYAGIADVYYGRSNMWLPPNEAMPRARAAAERAIALDESLPEAHTSLGIVKTVFEWDWTGAEREFKRALELRPGDAQAHFWYAHLLTALGRFDEAEVQRSRALELDPLSPMMGANAAFQNYIARRFDVSIEIARSTIRLDPGFFMTYGFLGMALFQKGDVAGAIASLEKQHAMDKNADGFSQLAWVYGSAGQRGKALAIRRELLLRRDTTFVASADLAFVELGLGNRSAALDWLEKSAADHSELLIFVNQDPFFDALRPDPRFVAIIRRLGLTPRT